MNLGKLATPSSKKLKRTLTETESDYEEKAMIGNCCSLVLCSTSHHGLQLEKGMNQGGNPFALAETGIQNQYTHAKGMILSLCQIMLFKKQSYSGHKSYLSRIDPQTPPSSTYGKKRVGNSSAKVDRSVPQEQIV